MLNSKALINKIPNLVFHLDASNLFGTGDKPTNGYIIKQTDNIVNLKDHSAFSIDLSGGYLVTFKTEPDRIEVRRGSDVVTNPVLFYPLSSSFSVYSIFIVSRSAPLSTVFSRNNIVEFNSSYGLIDETNVNPYPYFSNYTRTLLFGQASTGLDTTNTVPLINAIRTGLDKTNIVKVLSPSSPALMSVTHNGRVEANTTTAIARAINQVGIGKTTDARATDCDIMELIILDSTSEELLNRVEGYLKLKHKL